MVLACDVRHGQVPVAGKFASARGKKLSFALCIALCASTEAFNGYQCGLLQGEGCSVFRIHRYVQGDLLII